MLEVEFLDINDNPPKFTSPPEIIRIPEKLENKILTPLFTFTVTDADIDQNAMVRFRLIDCPVLGYENNFDIFFCKNESSVDLSSFNLILAGFSINFISGELSVLTVLAKTLSTEVTCKVTASDLGATNQLSSTIEVLIKPTLQALITAVDWENEATGKNFLATIYQKR